MLLLLVLHVVVGMAAIAVGGALGRRVLVLCTLAPATALGWLAWHLGDVLDGRVVHERTAWVPSLGLHVELRLDGFAALMVAVVSGVGVLVLLYAARYFAPDAHHLGRLAGLLTIFSGSMLGVVLADDLLLLYTCWELTSITSYLLIGHHHTEARARAAALHALLITSAGGLTMLAGFVLLGQAAGSYRLSDVLAAAPTGTDVSVGVVLVLVGVATKSAQYPFHGWLPGAMAAPTPVSAYLHAATMVKAGVVLLARLAPVFAVLGFWRPLVLTVGLVTMVAGGLRALRQHDLKLLLAFGTVSQLGLLVVLFGAGVPEATAAGCVLLLGHAAFKAALFLVVGLVDRMTGTRDLRELPRLGPRWRPVAVVTVVSCASMAGLPLALGFVAKEAAYTAFLDDAFGGSGVVLAAVVAGSALTAAYSFRFGWGLLGEPAERGAAVHDDAPAPGFAAPAVILAVATVVTGVVPRFLDDLVASAATSLTPGSHPGHLSLWHGFNAALALSALTIALGAAVVVGRRPVARVLAAGGRLPNSGDAYLAILRALNRLADRLTGVVQNGSLPVYAGVILLTAALLPTGALLLGGEWPGWPDVVDAPAHVPVAALLVGSALAAATIRRRLSAVLFLGVAGYAMAALFVVQGAPDLALTQVAIETLSTVLFVLVLRHLPDRFERRASQRRRVLRLGVATTVGLSVFCFALYAGANRTADPISGEMVERALPDGGGRNIVNVILVDFRGLDTLGEITVLAAAAIGMVALARAGRRPHPHAPTDADESVGPVA